MSQPQPGYYPPQPIKKSSTGRILVVVLVVVALVAGLGAYGTYRIFQAADQLTGGGLANAVDISGNSLMETVPIGTNSTVDMSCNYCTVTLQLRAQHVTADIDLSGNYNHLTVIGGETNLSVSGNYNTVNVGQTIVLSVQNSGNGNTVNR